ncbi:MAG: MFS transporter [Paenibacillaceae bacterium]
MKTALWLYFFLFVAFFDLHAQYPILTPFAVSLGATPSFIGLIMGMYSITHLPGNLIAGYSVDRMGSRVFIVLSLLLAGCILLLQSHVTNPWQLLVLRSISGFVLAFLSPACMALLARIGQNQLQQGKLMAGNGLVHTLASVISPAAGALLVAQIGFALAFNILGWVLILTAICALFFITDREVDRQPMGKLEKKFISSSSGSVSWIVFALPVAMSCSQGILFFELPLMASSNNAIMTTGLLFSVVSLGALITLSMLFLNRYSPFIRTLSGAVVLAFSFFAMVLNLPAPIYMLLLFVGMAKGIIFPALSSLLIQLSGGSRYGRTFSLLSIALSIGAFLGPMLAGQLRNYVSPYLIAFIVLMIAASILPFHNVRAPIVNTHQS